MIFKISYIGEDFCDRAVYDRAYLYVYHLNLSFHQMGRHKPHIWFDICGFNIAVLSSLIATIFGRLLGRWRAAVATIVGITFYSLLVGADPAVRVTTKTAGLSSPRTASSLKKSAMLPA
jgi:hypothetical protein